MDRKTISNFSNRELVKHYHHSKKHNLLGKKSKLEKEIENRKINPNTKYAHLCSNPEDFIGNKFQDSSNLIIIKFKNTFVCFTRREFASMKKENHYTNQNDLKPFYVIPYINVYVDESIQDLFNSRVNTMELKSKGKIGFKHKGQMEVYEALKMKRCDLYENKDCNESDEYNENEIEDEIKIQEIDMTNIIKEAEEKTKERARKMFVGHMNNITCIAYKNNYIASGDEGDKVFVWDIDSWEAKMDIKTNNTISSVDFSLSPENDTILAIGDFDTKINILYLENKTSYKITDHTDFVTCVRFSPNGRYLASCGWDKIVRIWDMIELRTDFEGIGHTDYIFSLSWIDNNTLASGSADNTVRIWNIETRENIKTFQEKSFVYALCASPDGKYLATGDVYGNLHIWNIEEEKYSQIENEGEVKCISYSPNGKLILFGGHEYLKLYNTETKDLRILKTHRTVACLFISNNNICYSQETRVVVKNLQNDF